MAGFRQVIAAVFMYLCTWLNECLKWVQRRFNSRLNWAEFRQADPDLTKHKPENQQSDVWRTHQDYRTYRHQSNGPMVMVKTSTHTFHVDLEKLADCSEYFRALSHSCMKEMSERLVHLEHVPSLVFHNLLEFCFLQRFCVPEDLLMEHLRVSSYLLATSFTDRLLITLSQALTEHTCPSYLQLAEGLCSVELQETVLTFMSKHLLELPHLSKGLDEHLHAKVLRLRSNGTPRLCCLRKENLTSRSDPETDAARKLFRLEEGDYGKWSPLIDLPFCADKWCFTTAVVYNYLYVIGGYRHRVKKGYEFKMASFRYNPLTHRWVSMAPLIKHRRHFSAAVCEERIYAVGGWYLDSLVTPDSSTGVYTAVEVYDPWTDAWSFVSSLPLTDFQFSLSLSHDSPLTTSLGHCLYVLGNIARTGEKLVLRYDTRQDCWCELLPTLTRSSADLPSLHFLGAADSQLIVIGGNNSETIVTSFCVESKKWGQIRAMEKSTFIGQGTVLHNDLYTSGTNHSIVKVNLQSLSLSALPSLPVSTCYESLFHLCF
ncbi:kelch-like protein 42 [Triplophysa rosa]|uniref:Kelch repeat and BTB domain-containing protein 13-like n=1 Tax=Triplophysa rosa TaxID=992332 RepID=A0A9W7WK17_TRIRA|nr:kelch-like protein 42 [Triplophysa rosa]KAI7802444.1 putative kelch repeat and BTB domain-containing protein 13-like [Triplophysa rosa]